VSSNYPFAFPFNMSFINVMNEVLKVKAYQHKILHRSLSLGQKVTLNNFVKHNMGNTFIFFHILKTFNIEFRLVLAISPCIGKRIRKQQVKVIIQKIIGKKTWWYRDYTKRDNRSNKDKTNKQNWTWTPQKIKQNFMLWLFVLWLFVLYVVWHKK
jgi:hypothetical protein